MGVRKFFVAANWKIAETEPIDEILKILNTGALDSNAEVVVIPSAESLHYVRQHLTRSNIAVCAQDCSTGQSTVDTADLSPAKIKDCGAEWVLLGHWERRRRGESDQVVGEKVAVALSEGLKVMVCVGETLDQKAKVQTLDVIFSQLSTIAQHVTDWKRVVVVYEPQWALGTCKVATTQEILAVHKAIRDWLARSVGEEVDTRTRIIYGGVVNGNNCRGLAIKEDIDGFLVGETSIIPDFIRIVNSRK